MSGPEISMPGGSLSMFEYQNLDFIETTIVIDEWLTPLATTRNVKAWYLIVEQTNNGATNETLECELTVNGVVFLVTLPNIASGALQYVQFDLDGTTRIRGVVWQLLSLDGDQSAPLETRSLAIRVRQTTPVDVTSAQIEVNMVYATLEPTT